MMQFLQAVVAHGTAAAASQLHHPLGGKTGTTNDYTDAWFIGFSPSVTCGTWIGFDDRQSLGEKETGARAALPMWMDFMRAAIANRPNEAFATGGQPKRQLDVPAPADSPAPPKPETMDTPDDEVDPDTPATPPAPEPPGSPSIAPHATGATKATPRRSRSFGASHTLSASPITLKHT
jgi:penicillin-binding protein 1A